MSEKVEAYLDRLFDLLVGSGARGRRILVEAEAHLTEAVERAIAGGAPRDEAERNAIARFGSPEQIARAHNIACTLPFGAALTRVFAAAWLMAGVAGLAFLLMAALEALFTRAFGPSLVVAEWNDTRPLSVGAAALTLLVLFAAARRTSALRRFTQLPSNAMMSTAGAVGFGGVGVVLLAYGALGAALGHPVELGEHLAQGVAGVVAGLVFLPFAWRQVTLDGVAQRA